MAQEKKALIGAQQINGQRVVDKKQPEFSAPVPTGPQVPENNTPLTGSIFFPNGAGVTEIVQRQGSKDKLVGFTFIIDEAKAPVTMVFSLADARQMKEMLDGVIKALDR